MSLNPDQLKSKKIRQAYESAGEKINAAEMAKIVKAAVNQKKVSATAKADLKLILSKGKLTDLAKEKVKEFLRDNKQLVGTGLKKVVETIYGFANVEKIVFRDPINGLHYEPKHYKYIAGLVSDNDIDVWQYTKEGSSALGSYVSSADNLFISVGQHKTDLQRQSTIVHEATHAIQDKTNVQITRWDAEAAAHIAQAVMLLTHKSDGSLLYNRLKKPAIRNAAEKVLEKKKISALTEKDFKATYEVLKVAYPTNDKRPFDSEWYSFFEQLAFFLGTQGDEKKKK